MLLKFFAGGGNAKAPDAAPKAVKIKRRAEGERDSKKRAEMLRVAAKLFRRAGDFSSAIECEEKAATASADAGDWFSAAMSHRNISHDAYEKSDFSTAIEYAKKAVSEFGKVNAFYAIKWCFNDMAFIYEKRGDLVSAIKYYAKSNEIEKEEEVERKIEELMNLVTHPTIEQKPSASEVLDGEDVIFTLAISNRTSHDIANIYITDESGSTLDFIKLLKPGERKEFSYTVKARGTFASPPYSFIMWKAPLGDAVLKKKIEPATVTVDQRIKVFAHIKRRLRYGEESYFAITVKNNSSTRIENVKLHAVFPAELRIKPVTGYRIEKIMPGEEKSFIFKVIPLDVGKTIIDGAFIEFTNESYERIKLPVERIVLEEVFENEGLPVPEPKKLAENKIAVAKKAYESKKDLHVLLMPKKMDIGEFMDLAKKFESETKGTTLKGIDVETAYMHVMEECRGLHTVSTRFSHDEALAMFSAQSHDGKTYLLTIAIRMKGDICNIAFKMHSSEKEGLKEMLQKVSDIITYTILVMNEAKEVEKIEINEVINIVDSVVQRSKLGAASPGKEKAKINIKDSVVQRTEI